MLPSILIFFSFVLLILNKQQMQAYRSALQTQTKLNNQLTKRQFKANKELVTQAKEKYGTSLKFQQMSSRFETQTDQIFESLYTFSDYQSYLQRQKQLKKWFTPELLKDPKLFAKPVDSSGGDYIGTLKLSSTYGGSETFTKPELNQNGELVALVKVTYHAKNGDHATGVGRAIYQVSYNLQRRKFTQVQQITKLATTVQD